MSLNDPRLEWMDKPDLFVNIDGFCMDKLSLEFEIGQYPKIKGSLSIKRLLEILNDNDLNSLIIFCGLRLSVPKNR